MRYVMLFTMNPGLEGASPEQMQDVYSKVDAWWHQHSESGAIKGGEQLQPARTATTVRPAQGSVTDGPFIEAKEEIGGFAIIEVPDLDAAIAMAKTWPASPSVEIRPVVEDNGM